MSSKKYIYMVVAGIVLVVSMIAYGAAIDSLTINRIEPEYVEYSVFRADLDAGKLWALYTSKEDDKVRFKYREDISEDLLSTDPNETKVMDLDLDNWYYTLYLDSDAFDTLIVESGTPLIEGAFNTKTKKYIDLALSLSGSVLMIALLLALLDALSSQMHIGGGDKFEVITQSPVRFSDVIGHDEVIEDMKSYIKALVLHKKLVEKSVKPPKGVLFTGAPGTGKTLIAKAMAGEAGIPFIYLNSSNVIEIFVGVGSKAIRACFKKARELAPCIVFLDEIDAIGRKRSDRMGTSENNQTLLALLQELDGFKQNNGVLVIAATNCPDELDAALRRAGRFDREIIISPPRNCHVRKSLLEHYTKDYKLSSDVSLDALSRQTSGMTGADIAFICNEAALNSVLMKTEIGTNKGDFSGTIKSLSEQIREDGISKGDLTNDTVKSKFRLRTAIEAKKIVAEEDARRKGLPEGAPNSAVLKEIKSKDVKLSLEDFNIAIDKLLLKGNRLKDKSIISEKDREIVAYHEAGHAVMSFLLAKPFSRISIQGTTSGVGGFVLPTDKESQFRTEHEIKDNIMIAYGGRLSETIKFGESKVTTGAANDIQQATDYVSQYVMHYGFSCLGLLDYGVLAENNSVNKDELVNVMYGVSEECRKRAYTLLNKYYGLVEALAVKLLDDETMTGNVAESLLREEVTKQYGNIQVPVSESI